MRSFPFLEIGASARARLVLPFAALVLLAPPFGTDARAAPQADDDYLEYYEDDPETEAAPAEDDGSIRGDGEAIDEGGLHQGERDGAPPSNPAMVRRGRQPEEPDFDARPRPWRCDVSLPFSESWAMEVKGTITNIHGFARLFNGPAPKGTRIIDVWTTNGRGLAIRLANRKINFTKSSVGTVNNPAGPPDHWLLTTVPGMSVGEEHVMRIVNYGPRRRVIVWWDDVIVGDSYYKVKHPAAVGRIVFDGMRGKRRCAFEGADDYEYESYFQ